MKINIDIDCTPLEARAFLGLPDFTPVQAMMVARLGEMIEQSLDPAAAQALMQSWMSAGLANMESLQRQFWHAATGGDGGDKPKK
ncbi:MAG: hypothetical protein D6782_12815 [Alphaproteobacteria bacterium]|nr:MAG: hypothetical protein D6782_12815 [Alphaproteobacteria bacterium]